MGKSTISTGPFSIAMLVHQRVPQKKVILPETHSNLSALHSLPPWSTASCPSLFPRPFQYHPAQVQTFATGRLQISNNWKKKTQQTTKEHCATMQKETNSRPNNRTECSPCLRRRLHFVHLFFQGHFEIVLHKCKRLQQADFNSVTTGRKKNTTNNKRTLCHYAKGNQFETQQQN